MSFTSESIVVGACVKRYPKSVTSYFRDFLLSDGHPYDPWRVGGFVQFPARFGFLFTSAHLNVNSGNIQGPDERDRLVGSGWHP